MKGFVRFVEQLDRLSDGGHGNVVGRSGAPIARNGK
jgi:hypothetical protein